MKTVTILFVVWISLGIQGMFGQRELDTIYANEHQAVALFFPSPIRQAVTGDQQFVFSYDRERAGHLGLLQGVDGVISNLLVITTDGKVYAYILIYAKSLPQMNYFFDEKASVGVERPEGKLRGKDNLGKVRNPYEGICKLLLGRAPKKLGTAHNRGLRLRLEELVYDGDKVYLLVGIRNRSKIDFEMERLDFYQVSANKKRRSSRQEITLQPLYTCTASTLIKSGKEIRLAYVLSKFVLGKGESMKLILEEADGNRRVVLKK
ncbi:DUF4138 domain-containing protein [Allomuricauda sp. NBRC 101325]|uniref:DUF4138 domain-containing protein n=1 Tax=Allomuricauda sp. NBRC 101325 TaxID=1113758 RepID=UPI0024A57639|nr:DUF4138 domain-containing protein [Muricauda sp. NBRC 101325]GLU45130.1 hypothetical protein Musp01_27540 [Muricauda sp. NBRC 101325]